MFEKLRKLITKFTGESVTTNLFYWKRVDKKKA